MPQSTVRGRCKRCGRTIEVGQNFEWGQARGERLHDYPCQSAPPAPAPAPTPGFVPPAYEDSSDWSVSLEVHETDDPNIPRVTIWKVSRIRLAEGQIAETIPKLWAQVIKGRGRQ